MTLRLGWVPVIAMLALPYIGFVLVGSDLLAVGQIPTFLWVCAGLLTLAGWIAKTDLWLGILTGWVVLWATWLPGRATFELACLYVVSAAALVTVQTLSVVHRERVRTLLLLAGVAQVAIATAQWFGYKGLLVSSSGAVIGMIGNPDYLAVYLAAITPLAPIWMMPLFLFGLWLCHSVIGLVAAVVGVAVMAPRGWDVIAVAGLFLLGAVLINKTMWSANVLSRWDVWMLSLQQTTAWSWLIGHGLGAWSRTIPDAQITYNVWNNGHGFFVQAHNEYLQTWYELGAVGLGAVALWFRQHRQIFTSSYRGAVVAILVSATAMFNLHIIAAASLVVVVFGLAIAETPTSAVA